MKQTILSFLLLIPSLIFGQVAIGSLTTTTLSQTGAEKLPISGSGTPGTTIANISDWITRGKVVNVEYGASASDQAPTIQAAIDAASAGDVLIISGTSYGNSGATGYIKVETSISVTKKLNIIGNFGARLKTSTASITILNLATGSAGSVVSGLQFEGTGEDSGSTSQVGIIVADDQIIITGCKGVDLGGAFIKGGGTSTHNTVMISNCAAKDCNRGFDITASYSTYTNCSAYSCNSGFVVSSGNLSLVNCSSNDSDIGIEFNTGTNTGRTRVIGGMFNHCTTYGIKITSADDPIVFSGVGILQSSGIWVKGVGTNPVFFEGCHFDVPITLDATPQRVVFIGCGITGSSTVSGDTSLLIKTNNYDDSGTLW